METVLEQLYYGKLNPFEKEQTERIRVARAQLREKEAALQEKLDDALLEELHDLFAEYTRLLSLDMEDDFINGFKLGVRMMSEVFQEEIKPETNAKEA
jgi:hypothetical protein